MARVFSQLLVRSVAGCQRRLSSDGPPKLQPYVGNSATAAGTILRRAARSRLSRRRSRRQEGLPSAWDQTVDILDDADEARANRQAEIMRLLRDKVRCSDGEEGGVCAEEVADSQPCLTNESLHQLIEHIRSGERVPLLDAMQLLHAALVVFRNEPTVADVAAGAGGRVVVVGDLHGQLGDLLRILDEFGLPGDHTGEGKHVPTQYVFNGDLVDRGNNSCEVLLLVAALKLSTPRAVHVNRGNHEDEEINVLYGFYDECRAKYNVQFFENAVEIFHWLPCATVLNTGVLVVHGGLWDGTLADLRKMPRGPPRYLSDEDMTVLSDLRWSDPAEDMTGRQPSPRGSGHSWGPDVTDVWLNENDVSLIVRSHQCKSETGVWENHGGKVLTVFSASNYYWPAWEGVDSPTARMAGSPNQGAVLVFHHEEMRPVEFRWDPVLMPVDNPAKSAVLPATGQPFQKVVPMGWLNPTRSRKLSIRGRAREHLCDTLSERRAAMLSLFSEADMEDSGLITRDTWRRILLTVSEKYSSVADQLTRDASLPEDEQMVAESIFGWLLTPRRGSVYLVSDITPADDTGNRAMMVNYRLFLERVDQEAGKAVGAAEAEWHVDLLATLTKHIDDSGVDLEGALKHFDQDGDGALQEKEISDVLRPLFPADLLSDRQLESLARRFDGINPQQFAEELRNAKTLRAGGGAGGKLQWNVDRRTERIKTLRKWLFGKEELLREALERTSEEEGTLPGRISRRGLLRALREDLEVSCHDSDAADIAAHVGMRTPSSVDLGTGMGRTLSIPRVVTSLSGSKPLQGVDTAVALELGRSLITLLYRHREELRHVLRTVAPVDGAADGGQIPVERFRDVINVLNELDGYPLTRQQADALVEAIDIDKNGLIGYDEIRRVLQLER